METTTESIDWKLKLLQILHCFGELEGTWYDNSWETYGISSEEVRIIEEAYDEARDQGILPGYYK